MGETKSSPSFFMSRNEKWEEKTLCRIKREFSQIEKYNLLVKNYQEMENKLEIYKKQVTKLQETCGLYKKQYGELQSKYVKICNIYKINEYEYSERL